MAAKKKAASLQMRIVRPSGTPVPMPTRKPNRAPGQATPVPMPTRESNYGNARPSYPPRKPEGPKKTKTPLITLTKPKRQPSGPLKAKRGTARRKMI